MYNNSSSSYPYYDPLEIGEQENEQNEQQNTEHRGLQLKEYKQSLLGGFIGTSLLYVQKNLTPYYLNNTMAQGFVPGLSAGLGAMILLKSTLKNASLKGQNWAGFMMWSMLHLTAISDAPEVLTDSYLGHNPWLTRLTGAAIAIPVTSLHIYSLRQYIKNNPIDSQSCCECLKQPGKLIKQAGRDALNVLSGFGFGLIRYLPLAALGSGAALGIILSQYNEDNSPTPLEEWPYNVLASLIANAANLALMATSCVKEEVPKTFKGWGFIGLAILSNSLFALGVRHAIEENDFVDNELKGAMIGTILQMMDQLSIQGILQQLQLPQSDAEAEYNDPLIETDNDHKSSPEENTTQRFAIGDSSNQSNLTSDLSSQSSYSNWSWSDLFCKPFSCCFNRRSNSYSEENECLDSPSTSIELT